MFQEWVEPDEVCNIYILSVVYRVLDVSSLIVRSNFYFNTNSHFSDIISRMLSSEIKENNLC